MSRAAQAFGKLLNENEEAQHRQIDRLLSLFGADRIMTWVNEATTMSSSHPIAKRRDGTPRTRGGMFFRLARLYAWQRVKKGKLSVLGLYWLFSEDDQPAPDLDPPPKAPKVVRPPKPRTPKVTAPTPAKHSRPKTKPSNHRFNGRPDHDSYVSYGGGGSFGPPRRKFDRASPVVADVVYARRPSRPAD